ncbi:MAG: hypothetical protein KGL35_29930, partial [Bradyrhizobium sp.]|nr:hypothetical protein [Bradyrhizobium sp.]
MSAPVYTVDEAAAKLRKTPRWLAEWLRAHPRDGLDRPLFKQAGRTMIFTDRHIELIIEALPCPSKSSPAAAKKRKTSTSAA